MGELDLNQEYSILGGAMDETGEEEETFASNEGSEEVCVLACTLLSFLLPQLLFLACDVCSSLCQRESPARLLLASFAAVHFPPLFVSLLSTVFLTVSCCLLDHKKVPVFLHLRVTWLQTSCTDSSKHGRASPHLDFRHIFTVLRSITR